MDTDGLIIPQELLWTMKHVETPWDFAKKGRTVAIRKGGFCSTSTAGSLCLGGAWYFLVSQMFAWFFVKKNTKQKHYSKPSKPGLRHVLLVFRKSLFLEVSLGSRPHHHASPQESCWVIWHRPLRVRNAQSEGHVGGFLHDLSMKHGDLLGYDWGHSGRFTYNQLFHQKFDDLLGGYKPSISKHFVVIKWGHDITWYHIVDTCWM